MLVCSGFAAQSAEAPLRPVRFERRRPGPTDVQIEILYCGVCHSDLHTARNEWGGTLYPCVPGHEIVGRVTAVGGVVSRFRVGDLAGIGCIIDSCGGCTSCRAGAEQYCENGFTGTYNSQDRNGGGTTMGGYSSAMVADEAFVLKLPDNLDPAAMAPLLCAGITTWSPLRRWKVGAGQRVGVVGLGGLGHMAVKFAAAFGAETVLFTTSEGKAEDARRLGAASVILSRDAEAMAREAGRFDFVLDAVAAPHDINPYLRLLKQDGTLVQVGAPEAPLPVDVFNLIMKRRSFAGSLIGGIAETQEMLDFCGAHGITAEVELIRMDEINVAFERMLRSDVRYRFVIDMATLPPAA